VFFVRSWRGLTAGGGESARGFVFALEVSGKVTVGLTGVVGAAGAGAGDLLVLTAGRGADGLTGLVEARAKTESDLVLLVLVLFVAVERGSGTGFLMGLSRGAGTGGGGGGTDLAGGRTEADDFDGLGERASGGGGGFAGLGGVCVLLCGLGSLGPSVFFSSEIELVDSCALALAPAMALEGTTETGPYAAMRTGRGGGGGGELCSAATSMWWGGEGNGPACDAGTGGTETPL
jgi:hypothetical protein